MTGYKIIKLGFIYLFSGERMVPVCGRDFRLQPKIIRINQNLKSPFSGFKCETFKKNKQRKLHPEHYDRIHPTSP